ncbi:MAG: zinc-binding dehydrogenase [Oscillibacter sp.]|nr:zinc-binding dehydrogenase [Oscillibacter sp.]
MRAVVIDTITPAEEIMLTEVPVPAVRPGLVLVKVKAFGLNHSEQILRHEEINAAYIRKPVIPGIECVGEVVDPSDTRFIKGQRVCALMGGMGRSFNGSYAEYALLPEHHVFAMETDLPWVAAGAVPETYFTAWGSLFECLRLKADDTLLVRGGTCALGCKVIATTHRETKLSLLSNAGASVCMIDDGILTGKLRGITKALDLVGPRNLADTLTAVEKGAIVCSTGILGGVYTLNGFDPIKDIPNGVYLTGFFSNYPSQEIMDDIFGFLHAHKLTPCCGSVFDFENIRDAILAQDGKKADGKIVVSVGTESEI